MYKGDKHTSVDQIQPKTDVSKQVSSCLLASFPGPRPASRHLQATGSWARAWEQGYMPVVLTNSRH